MKIYTRNLFQFNLQINKIKIFDGYSLNRFMVHFKNKFGYSNGQIDYVLNQKQISGLIKIENDKIHIV